VNQRAASRTWTLEAGLIEMFFPQPDFRQLNAGRLTKVARFLAPILPMVRFSTIPSASESRGSGHGSRGSA
jgi:hypothetical protein